MWDTSTIASMEETAKSEVNQNCNLKIRGEWLEVIFDGHSADSPIEHFRYKWGKNFVSRKDAIEIHESR